MKSSGGASPSSASVLMDVVKKEGVMKLYNGLSAGLLRQATYTTTRLGEGVVISIALVKVNLDFNVL